MQRPYHEELGPVGERVFDRVVVEILIDAVAAIVPAAGGVGLDRPGTLHPAEFVDVVDVEVAVAAAAGPEEAVEPLDLIHQVADPVRLRRRREEADGAVQPVGPHHDQDRRFRRAGPGRPAPGGPRSDAT